jgi:hypothetical protein
LHILECQGISGKILLNKRGFASMKFQLSLIDFIRRSINCRSLVGIE